jgi:hypothetical protein
MRTTKESSYFIEASDATYEVTVDITYTWDDGTHDTAPSDELTLKVTGARIIDERGSEVSFDHMKLPDWVTKEISDQVRRELADDF